MVDNIRMLFKPTRYNSCHLVCRAFNMPVIYLVKYKLYAKYYLACLTFQFYLYILSH